MGCGGWILSTYTERLIYDILQIPWDICVNYELGRMLDIPLNGVGHNEETK